MVVAGSGRAKLDDEHHRARAPRRAPRRARSDASLRGRVRRVGAVAVGGRHEGDGEVIEDWWTD
ncbi:MAG: hypothetical protein AVDCRST_MAG45-2380 [uncultured Solirubrobacterales bacterium]|uniref:Uncharacterized protein n=1 Tax=uncultured Solirubrobacterales bacterium TaxID=768556 RepID=A0A6J4TBK8_9ACTN|nr:MAG: hypothetical protein AVDCRST_MAG45-2380 [uncultured Solirubrobacterales bacterium]